MPKKPFDVDDYMPRIFSLEPDEPHLVVPGEGNHGVLNFEKELADIQIIKNETAVSNRQLLELVRICADPDGPTTRDDVDKAIFRLRQQLSKAARHPDIDNLKKMRRHLRRNLSRDAVHQKRLIDEHLSFTEERHKVLNQVYFDLIDIRRARFGDSPSQRFSPEDIVDRMIGTANELEYSLIVTLRDSKLFIKENKTRLRSVRRRIDAVVSYWGIS